MRVVDRRPQLVACGMVVHRGLILATHRVMPSEPQWHDRWEFPGGKVEFFDSHPRKTAEREVFEETGFKVVAGIQVGDISVGIGKYGGAGAVVVCYLCFIEPGTYGALEPAPWPVRNDEYHDTHMWFDPFHPHVDFPDRFQHGSVEWVKSAMVRDRLA